MNGEVLEAAVEAVAKAICTECGENPVHCGDARGNDYRWQDYATTARAALIAALPFLQPDMEALRRDKERLDSGCLQFTSCDEMNGNYKVTWTECDLRALIDDGIAAQAGKQGGW